MKKIILFYLFTPLPDTAAVLLWQKTAAESFNLKGRIVISTQGINGTLGGDIEDIKKYIKLNKSYMPFKPIAYKWNEAEGEMFPRLSVKIRDELVTFNAKGKIKVGAKGVVNGGKRIKPEQLHDLVKEKDVVFFDGRNKYEANVGRFKNAVVPKTRTAKDFIPELASGKYDHLKDKTVVTYCTGGIRCEVLSALMVDKGFKDVYQLDGGIVKYGEKYGNQGLWEGSLYVFDGRMGIKFNGESKDIGKCIHCKQLTSNYENCALKRCNDLVLICQDCLKKPANLYHSEECLKEDQLITSEQKA
jgi:UPF0176 protein